MARIRKAKPRRRKKSNRADKRVSPYRRAIASFQNAMRGAADRVAVLSQVREDLPAGAFGELLIWLQRHAFAGRRALHDPFPRSFAQLRSISPLGPTSPEKEVRWAAAYISLFGERLRSFCDLSRSYHAAYLQGNHAGAISVIEQIEGEIGLSLWTMKRRILLRQLSNGLDAQKEYTATVRREAPSVTSYIAFFTSMAAEPSVTANRLRERLQQSLSGSSVPSDLSAYLRYQVLGEVPQDKVSLSAVLRHENAGAIADYYETFVDCLPHASSWLNTPAFVEALSSTASRLYRLTGDPRLVGAISYLGSESVDRQPASRASVEAADALLRGNYQYAADLALRELSIDPTDVDCSTVASEALARMGDQAAPDGAEPWRRLVGSTARLLRRDASAGAAIIDLFKEALFMQGTPWGKVLSAVLDTEGTPRPMWGPGSPALVAAIALPTTHPFRAGWLDTWEKRSAYAEATRRTCGDTLSSRVAVALSAPPQTALSDEVATPERDIAMATHAFRVHDFDEARRLAEGHIDAPSLLHRRRAVWLLCRTLIHMGEVEESVRHVVEAALSSPSWRDVLPIEELGDDLAVLPARSAKNIAIPILFDLFGRYVSPRHEAQCRFSALDFVEAHGFEKPSELRAAAADYDAVQLAYFLREVCVEATLNRSFLFAGSRDLLEERLRICELLCEIDQPQRDVYEAEIHSLNRRLMLQRRIPEIEQSRIYLDHDRIWRRAIDEFGDLFDRYVALTRQQGAAEASPELRKAMLKATIGVADVEELTKLALALPQNEAKDVLHLLVRAVRDLYVSPEYGLEKYLSVRIRHGALTSQLRQPLDAHNLMTSRAIGAADYVPNWHWARTAAPLDAGLQEQIARRLAAFSRDFDALIDQLLGWIHVKRNVDEPGVFDFVLSEQRLRLLTEYASPDMTFETFLDELLSNLDGWLVGNVATARDRVINSARSTAIKMIDQLIADVEAVVSADHRGELIHAVRTARTELSNAFERVGAWFRYSRSAASDPFLPEDVIEVAAEKVRALDPAFAVSIRKTGNTVQPLVGALLAPLYDIFFIAFENVVRHSHMSSPPSARVEIRDTGEVIHILIENDVGPEAACAEVDMRVQELRQKMLAGEYGASVAREGGTGLHKVANLLSDDLGMGNADLEFGLRDGCVFFVRFSLRLLVETGRSEDIAS